MTLLLSDPEIRSLDVRDSGEALVPVPAALLEPHAAPTFARESVVERLLIAQQALPHRMRLAVVEAHRSVESQRRIYERYDRVLQELHPAMPDGQRKRLVSRFVSPIEVAPHVAGAAVDVTLATPSGLQLWLGTRIDATPEESDGACCFAATNIGRRAQRYRRILAMALGGAGFVNYPTEWWHWSFGDRYWAATTGADAALYGPAPAGPAPYGAEVRGPIDAAGATDLAIAS